jgi:transglutaminase superfamily protein
MKLRQTWLIAATLAGGYAAAGWAQDVATSWYDMVAANGQRLGYVSRRVVPRRSGREIVEATYVRLRGQDGGPLPVTTRTYRVEDSSGRPLSIVQVSRTGPSRSRLEARIGTGSAEIRRRAASDDRVVRLALPPGVRFDGGAGLLARWDPRTTPRLEFDNLNIDAMAVERVVIEPVAASAGSVTEAVRKRYDGSELRGVARLRLDGQGEIVGVTQPMFGTAISTVPTTRDQALRAHAPYHVLANAMVRSPFRLPPAALQGQIRYRVSFAEELDFPLPQTGEQRVRSEGGGATIDICSTCGPGLASDAQSLAQARAPTPWLQSDHPRLRALAQPIARLPVMEARKMELLRERARPLMPRVDFNGHFSALETLERGAGDCTEAAVLLAALGRAAGIPTRVANGLVYSRERYHGVSHAFMPHSWTLAWVEGRWRSFDLALDSFDSSHIALTIGDGDTASVHAASQLASLLRWEGMTEVRSREN